MKNLYIASLCLLLFTYGCKKSESKPDSNTNVLCDGNGSSDLYPLNIGNYWKYKVIITGVVQPKPAKIEILKDTISGGKKYFFLTDSSNQMFGASRFYRKDTGNHTLYFFSSYNEAVDIVKSPSKNQTWNSIFYSRVAVNLNASLKTSACNYTGLIQVNEMNGGSIKTRLYYKKGLGLVYSVSPNAPMNGDSVEYILTDARIK